jgi:hypothetical protein
MRCRGGLKAVWVIAAFVAAGPCPTRAQTQSEQADPVPRSSSAADDAVAGESLADRPGLWWFAGLGDDSYQVLQTVSVGAQLWKLEGWPVGLSALAGYSVAYGPRPRAVDSGAVVDVGAWYWLDPLGLHLGLHTRVGVHSATRDLRALLLSFGARQMF